MRSNKQQLRKQLRELRRARQKIAKVDKSAAREMRKQERELRRLIQQL